MLQWWQFMQEFYSLIQPTLSSRPDPLAVRTSTANVIKNLQLIFLDKEKLSEFGHIFKKRIQKGPLLTASQFGKREVISQKIFLLDVVNFCFWSPPGDQKWSVEYPQGQRWNGWLALAACFDRAIEEGVPLLDAAYLATLSLQDVRHIFRGRFGKEIPLLTQRQQFLREAGRILQEKFSGSFNNFLSQVGYAAPAIAKNLLKHFSSFTDSATFAGREVHFLKRAQICAYDLSLLPENHIRGTEELTIFADYKLPQLLRHIGVLRYHPTLTRKVDAYKLISKGSQEEIEIRSATIWVGELLADALGVSPVLVDNALWSMAATITEPMAPYHRTLTTCY